MRAPRVGRAFCCSSGGLPSSHPPPCPCRPLRTTNTKQVDELRTVLQWGAQPSSLTSTHRHAGAAPCAQLTPNRWTSCKTCAWRPPCCSGGPSLLPSPPPTAMPVPPPAHTLQVDELWDLRVEAIVQQWEGSASFLRGAARRAQQLAEERGAEVAREVRACACGCARWGWGWWFGGV